MKKREKGFMLVETLVVSTLVSTILIGLYLQFNNIINSFNKDFNYNSVDNMYAVQNVKKFILNDNNGDFYNTLKSILNEQITKGTSNFVEIYTNCSNNSGVNYRLDDCTNFSTLNTFYNVERIIITKEFVDLKDSDYKTINDPNLEKFIKSIKSEYTAEDYESNKAIYNYRIIVKFKGNEYATLKMSN